MHAQSRKFDLHGLMRLIRFPNLMMIALGQYMTAIWLVGKDGQQWAIFTDANLFILVLSTLIIAASGYMINDYYDVKIDFINKPDQVIVGRLLKRRKVMTAHTILNFLGIALALLLGIMIGIINFISAFLLWLYSNQLKRMPFIGNFVVACLTAVSIGLVGYYYQQNETLVYTYAIFAYAFTLVREIIKDMEDMRGDEKFGCKTLPLTLGIPATKYILYALLILFLILLALMALKVDNQILTVYFSFLSIPFMIFVAKLYRADKKKDFSTLSKYCKLIMLSGIISMAFF